MSAIKQRFILVDDDPGNNLLCRFLLKKHFPEALIVDFIYPENAMQFFENDTAYSEFSTILFLDLNMPVLSGWDVLKALQQLNSEQIQSYHICILSSSIDQRDLDRAASNPLVKAYIEKPLSLEKVESALQSSRK